MPPYSLFAERSIRNTPYVPEKLGIPTGGTDYRCTDGHLGSWHNVCGKVPHRDSPLSWIKRARRVYPLKKKGVAGSIPSLRFTRTPLNNIINKLFFITSFVGLSLARRAANENASVNGILLYPRSIISLRAWRIIRFVKIEN